jgi:hypothetical protein
MKYFITLFQKTMKADKKILGRWILERCEKKREQQIYVANKDYGCPNGFYKMKEEKEIQNDINEEIRFRYMV